MGGGDDSQNAGGMMSGVPCKGGPQVCGCVIPEIERLVCDGCRNSTCVLQVIISWLTAGSCSYFVKRHGRCSFATISCLCHLVYIQITWF